ncbi:MBL fold metallo-hydrolase [Allosaccharopolyspora coralli]|uniref:MBL fold metallo-hydrolase n=1 Tax=Allosaccharopolyspora coralli TaxID=2665642 RepID=A0A5Q3QC60_9PSEU|nr:MBL fold metallo-hydrolase [Allosaccharopolyspora coralli]QGK68387.1 MBL fold metallo-hydrolase [Allosaccharopolyspora coralli]
MNHPAYGRLREVTPFAAVVLADNPSPMTLDGTNTWLVGDGDSRTVIDPGPDDAEHLRTVASRGPVALVLLTHHHPDHVEGAETFAELTGAPVRALDPALCRGGPPLRDGEVVDASGVDLTVLATPGHTSDSVSFAASHGGVSAVFTGDSILGRGTSIIAHPDGHLGSYFDSLRRLGELPEGSMVLPGHGPELPDVREIVTAYREHRTQRLEQVRTARAQLGPDATAMQVVKVVYADVDRAVWPAAEATVQAQLTYIEEA